MEESATAIEVQSRWTSTPGGVCAGKLVARAVQSALRFVQLT